jgi:hypothetical protein
MAESLSYRREVVVMAEKDGKACQEQQSNPLQFQPEVTLIAAQQATEFHMRQESGN